MMINTKYDTLPTSIQDQLDEAIKQLACSVTLFGWESVTFADVEVDEVYDDEELIDEIVEAVAELNYATVKFNTEVIEDGEDGEDITFRLTIHKR